MVELNTSMPINQIINAIINVCYFYNIDFAVEKNKNIVNIFVEDYKFVIHYYDDNNVIIITRITPDRSMSLKDFANIHKILRDVSCK